MQRVKITISTKTMIRFWFVVIAFILAGYALYSARTALLIIGISLFFAIALNTPVSKISSLLPGKSRIGATALSYLVLVTLLGTLIVTVIPPVVEQTAKFTQTIPAISDQLIDRWSALSEIMQKYGLEEQLNDSLQSLEKTAAHFATNVGKFAVGSIGSLMNFVTALILVLVLTFLMLIEGPHWIEKYWKLISDKKKRQSQQRVLDRVYGVITGYVNGQLTVSAIGASAAGAMVFILSLIFHDVPSNLAAPIAVITFIFSLIPMFGAVIGGVIASMLLLMNSLSATIVYIIFFVVYQQIENNFISPVIQGKRIDLSALVVLMAITIGVYVFGILGGIIAIPVAGTIQVLLDEYYFNKTHPSPPTSDKNLKAKPKKS